MEYQLKEYSKEYEKEVIDLLIEVCVEEYGLDHYKDGLIEHVESDEAKKRWILLHNEKLIATICYTERCKEISEIKKVYVKKEYRNLGIGKKMMNMVIDYIKNTQQYESIYVGTSDHFESARKFYEKLGFEFKSYEGDGYLLEMKLGGNVKEWIA